VHGESASSVIALLQKRATLGRSRRNSPLTCCTGTGNFPELPGSRRQQWTPVTTQPLLQELARKWPGALNWAFSAPDINRWTADGFLINQP